MTLTETRHPDHTVDNHTTDNQTKEQAGVTRSPFARLAGPMALTAGILITVAQLVMLPFDPKDHMATSQSVTFQAGGVIYMIGFVALMFALLGTYAWQARQAGRFGMLAVSTAVVGTMLLGGDLWFETFAVPSFADGPAGAQVLNGDPSVLLGIGAIASYLLFAVGWALFGIASFRARVFPRVISIALVIGGIVGFQALLSPFAIPLGLGVAALGVWMTRRTHSVDEVVVPASN
jgi:hypothetical protein